jgi:phosphatidylglycerophosphatase A
MATNIPTWRFILSRPAYFLAFGFGSGLSPKAPGTFGTLVAFPLFWLLAGLSAPIFLAVVAALFVVGIWVCGAAGKALGVPDHGGIVWDEIVAMLLVLAFAPRTLAGFAAAFVLFRLFDIWKPFPIRWFDRRLKNGFGVMLDDLLAAGYTVLCLWLVFGGGR